MGINPLWHLRLSYLRVSLYPGFVIEILDCMRIPHLPVFCISLTVCTLFILYFSYRYIPEAFSGKMELTLDEVNTVNRLNYDLSRNLGYRNQEAFVFYQHGNFSCVQIKTVSCLKGFYWCFVYCLCCICWQVPAGKTVHELMEVLYEETDKMESTRKASPMPYTTHM